MPIDNYEFDPIGQADTTELLPGKLSPIGPAGQGDAENPVEIAPGFGQQSVGALARLNVRRYVHRCARGRRLEPRSSKIGNLTLQRLVYKLGTQLARIPFIRSAIEERADLSAFDHKPTVRIVVGVSMVGFSFVMCWPAISALTTISVFVRRPWIAVIGGPVLYGLSHLCFLGGMALAGAKYARLFFRWLMRVWVESMLSCGPERATGEAKPVSPELELATPAPREEP
jgi:hypothetical protein